MFQSGRAHTGTRTAQPWLARMDSSSWQRRWRGVAAAEVFCHEEHAADQHCAVCELRHQPAAELSGSLHIGFVDVAEPIEQAPDVGWIASVHSRRLPARGPPASATDLNFFVYDIDNFIFGDRSEEVLDNLPVFHILQGNSRFTGFDARSSVRLGGLTWLTLGLGYVDAHLTTTGEALPRIPPLRGSLELDIPYGGFTLSPQLEFAGRQADVFRGETETDGYSVVNLRASYVWPRQDMANMLSFTGYNLTNELYRNHTSFIKDLAPEMGRGVRLNYAVRFH